MNINKNLINTYFYEKNWESISVLKGIRFFKQNSKIFINEQVEYFEGKKLNLSVDDAISIFKERTFGYFSTKLDGELKKLNPINIFCGYKNNSFVSTGLEYYYSYLYNDAKIEYKSTYLVQPSIRFKLDFINASNYKNNDNYRFSSMAFNNVSIVESESDCYIAKKIDNVIGYLSFLGIHASRVNFVLEDNVREKGNNVKYIAIKFFVDNLEIGDILFFKTNKGYLTEYGFGLERLLSRILNIDYKSLISCENYSDFLVRGSNFLTSLSIFDNSMMNRGAKSNINRVINEMKKCENYNSIDLLYNNYKYWIKVLDDVDKDFEKITDEYIRYLK